MELDFKDEDLEKLYCDPRATAGRGDAIDKGFRKVIQFIRGARDERDLYGMRSLRFERLKGNRSHQFSFRINNQWRLIVEIEKIENAKRVIVIGIEDYH